MPSMDDDDRNQRELTEPLLPLSEQPLDAKIEGTHRDKNAGSQSDSADQAGASCPDEEEGRGSVVPTGATPSPPSNGAEFSIQNELLEMATLGLPLAVSFFCRMGMASTDSAFVGHLHDEYHSAETYLAAAVLSDMVLNICITPPLAFNQVLNGLVAQAMGSNNPSMAGLWLQQSMFWLALTMLPCLTGLYYVKPILEGLGFPSEIAAVAGVYARYNVVWPIPNGLYQCMRFYFQARGLPRPAMYNNILFLFVNAGLNWILVFGGPFRSWNGLGFIGAAISITISRTMQGVCYYLYMFVYKQYHKTAWPEKGWSFSHHTRDRTTEFMKQSLPNIGTLLFQAAASQATTVLVGKLGELSIASSSALSTVTIPWSGTLSATCSTISGVRVGFHLGRGDAKAAKRSSWLVMHFITLANVLMAAVFLVPFLRNKILSVATSDENVLALSSTLVPAMLVATYLNLIVGNITSGVFGGQGRPLIATILSFGLELPLSIGGVAIYILVFHGNLIGVYWWNAISGGIEAAIVIYLMVASNWDQCADEARQRQEAARAPSNGDDGDDSNTLDDTIPSTVTADAASSSYPNEIEASSESEDGGDGDDGSESVPLTVTRR